MNGAIRGSTRRGYNILIRKPERKRPPSHGWEDNVKVDLKEIGPEGVD
jgi:hypothetical protein